MREFDSLLTIYRDEDFQANIDQISKQIEIIDSRLTEMLAANESLIEVLYNELN